ncbi:MAG: Endonuclease 4 [Chlamydiae bacterium]|nr:Endonuclease 4 [Chlamydiota bacterium]
MISADELLVGAHTSIEGGIHNALIEGKSIGATTIQLFTANQRQWKGKKLTEEAIVLFEETLEETGLQEIMSHAGYLINLGCPNQENLEKSRKAFREELERCIALKLTFLNFHPGAALDESREACLDRIIESLLLYEDFMDEDAPRLLLETTAGQGSVVGSAFEEIGYIIERVKDRLPIGVCMDTCHSFAAGYDIRTGGAWKKTLEQFDQAIGLEHLHAFHLNDSVKELGSHRDRHASLGEGEIGLECFRYLMTHPKTREIPKYLETPGGTPLWDKEIWMLREFARKKK